jgi:hypothetical protein
MAELEIHHEIEHADPMGRVIGVVASVLAVLLAVVTIVSHRAHTDAVLLKADANDQWSFYQSKRIKFHTIELGQDLIGLLGTGEKAEALAKRYASDKEKYANDADKAKKEAVEITVRVGKEEEKALFYDFGEGLLEIGLVLTSLYFIARSKIFPAVGITAGAVGVAVALLGWLK